MFRVALLSIAGTPVPRGRDHPRRTHPSRASAHAIRGARCPLTTNGRLVATVFRRGNLPPSGGRPPGPGDELHGGLCSRHHRPTAAKSCCCSTIPVSAQSAPKPCHGIAKLFMSRARPADVVAAVRLTHSPKDKADGDDLRCLAAHRRVSEAGRCPTPDGRQPRTRSKRSRQSRDRLSRSNTAQSARLRRRAQRLQCVPPNPKQAWSGQAGWRR